MGIGLKGFISKKTKQKLFYKRENPESRSGFALYSTANIANFHPNWIWNYWDSCPRIFHGYYFVYSWSDFKG